MILINHFYIFHNQFQDVLLIHLIFLFHFHVQLNIYFFHQLKNLIDLNFL